MKPNRIISKIAALALLLGIALTASYVSADWSAPKHSAPTCLTGEEGCEPPVNVGTIAQVKDGSLSVNAFIANMNALFKQDVTLDRFKTGGTVPTSAGGDRTLCADNTGKIVPCQTASYTDMTDLFMFSITWDGVKWVPGPFRTIMTSNPANVGRQDRLTIFDIQHPATGYYKFGSLLDYNFAMDSSEIISATLNSAGCGGGSGTDAYKLNLVNYDSSNRIEFEVSDDDSRNDVCYGAQVTFLYGQPTARP